MASHEDTAAGSVAQPLTARLEAATGELLQLEALVKSGELDARVLSEFRNAVDHIRSTTWAVQKWLGLNSESGGDPFSVLPIMSAERVKRGIQIANDLSLDLQTVDVGIETPGITELFDAIDNLRRRLAVLLKREV
jgi:hypothetical protein